VKYLPFENYTISTTLSIEQAKQRLSDSLEPDRSPDYIMHHKTKPFTGRISMDEFSINRVIMYRNSFLPDVKGRFVDEMGHTEIRIVMRPSVFVLAFMGIWMSGALIACVAAFGSLIDNSGARPFSPFQLAPFGMVLFGYGLCTVAFKAESKKAKQFLSDLWG
jgi:hypothetical protein